jgi:hypothetical protein
LDSIVDAYWRRVSASTGQKIDFTVSTRGGGQGTSIEHPGLEVSPLPIDFGDLDELAHKGLIRLNGSRPKSGAMLPTAEGKQVVEEQRQIAGIVRADTAISQGAGSGIGWEDTLPVLEVVVDLYPDSPPGLGVSQGQVNQQLGREDGDPDTGRKFEMLQQAGYVRGFLETDQTPGPLMAAPTEKALQLLGGWPADGSVALERFTGTLEARIEASTDEEEKGKLRAMLDAVKGVGQELAGRRSGKGHPGRIGGFEMQEPLENLSADAQDICAFLARQDDNKELEEIAAELDDGRLRPGQVADALRELEAGQRVVEGFGGWDTLE